MANICPHGRFFFFFCLLRQHFDIEILSRSDNVDVYVLFVFGSPVLCVI